MFHFCVFCKAYLYTPTSSSVSSQVIAKDQELFFPQYVHLWILYKPPCRIFLANQVQGFVLFGFHANVFVVGLSLLVHRGSREVHNFIGTQTMASICITHPHPKMQGFMNFWDQRIAKHLDVFQDLNLKMQIVHCLGQSSTMCTCFRSIHKHLKAHPACNELES